MKHGVVIGVFALMLGVAPAAHAAPWVLDPAQSHLSFVGTQGKNVFEGGFGKFTVAIDFDKDHPEKGSITATVDTSSATAGSKDRDEYLPQPDWFNVVKFPQATFKSTSIRPAERDCYEAPGDLRIKDITKQVVIAFCLTPEGDHYRAKAKLPLLRNDYQVGIHDWGNEDYVKFRVDLSMDFAVKPALVVVP